MAENVETSARALLILYSIEPANTPGQKKCNLSSEPLRVIFVYSKIF